MALICAKRVPDSKAAQQDQPPNEAVLVSFMAMVALDGLLLQLNSFVTGQQHMIRFAVWEELYKKQGPACPLTTALMS